MRRTRPPIKTIASLRSMLAIAAVAAGLLWGSASHATAALYWGDADNTPFQISTASLSGGPAQSLLVTDPYFPVGVIATSDHIYFSGEYSMFSPRFGKIFRVPRGGGAFDPEPVVSIPEHLIGQNLAVDRRFLYWVDKTAGSIGRSLLDGSQVEENFVSAPACSVEFENNALTVTHTHIFWACDGDIGRAEIDGSNPEPAYIANAYNGDAGINATSGMTADSTHLYWSQYYPPTTVFRAPTGGPSPSPQTVLTGDQFGDPSLGFSGIARVGGKLFWAQQNSCCIGRSNPDGTSAELGFITGAVGPVQISASPESGRPVLAPGKARIRPGGRGSLRITVTNTGGVGTASVRFRSSSPRLVSIPGPLRVFLLPGETRRLRIVLRSRSKRAGTSRITAISDRGRSTAVVSVR